MKYTALFICLSFLLNKGFTQVEFAVLLIKSEKVTASSYESKAHGGFGDFLPGLTIDGDLSNASSWRAENEGQWIQYDFSSNVPVDHILIAFMKGDVRTYKYSIEASRGKGKKWKTLIPVSESQKTQGFQKINFPAGTRCRFIRITGFGNSDPEFKNWININEVRFHYRK